MNTKLAAGLFSFCLAAAIDAQAAQPLITDDTRTQGFGRWQLELEGTEGDERVTGRDHERFDGILSYGLGESADLELGLPWHRQGEDGVGDALLALKWRFFERNALSFALKPGFTVPTGDEQDGHGTGRVTWNVRGIVSYAPGALAAHGHLGYRRNENKLGQRESIDEFAAALTYQVGSVRFVGELTRETNPVPGGRSVRYTTVGAIWELARDFHLDAGWRQGHAGAPLDEALLLGATMRW